MTGAAGSPARADLARPLAERVPAWAHRAADALRGPARSLVPWLDLFTKVYLGLAFLRIAIRGTVMGIPTAMAIGGGNVFDALLASPLGFTVQALCPVLLLVGVATRLAALPLVIQALLLTSPDGPSDLEHFRAALLLSIVVFGPGALSLDRLLGRGLDTSAIPGVATYAAAGRAVTNKLGPATLLALRIWVASGLAAAASHEFRNVVPPEALGLVPLVEAMTGPTGGAALAVASALALGIGTRAAAAALVLALPLAAIGQDGDARLPWALLLCIVAARGAGSLSVDALLVALPFRRSDPIKHRDPHHVIVVGGGFGGIAAAKGLSGADCRVTVVDRNNHHLFQPLLYQVATAALSPADIATPIRALLRGQRNASVRLDEAVGVMSGERELLLAVGDTVASKAWRGGGVPGLAPAARQGGAYAARVICARLRGRTTPPPFRYRHLGSLATIGRQAAVADFNAVRFRGGLAWWLWSIAHIAFIYGGRNRAAVLLDWAWAYLTFQRGARLITGSGGAVRRLTGVVDDSDRPFAIRTKPR